MCLVNKQENAGQKVISDEKLKLFSLLSFSLYTLLAYKNTARHFSLN